MKIMRQSFPYLALCLLIMLRTASPVFASTSATITGRVTDRQDLVVPGAQVQATNILTNINYAGETNEDGFYRIPNLPPGEYRVIVQKDGFASVAKPGVELHVQDVITLNFAMQVGSVTQTITVEGGAPLVSTESAAVSTVVDRQFVEDLPLNGRSFQTLFQLTPGVVLTKASFSDQGQFSVNGQRADANYFILDGVSANTGITAGTSLAQSVGGALPGLTVLGGTSGLVSVDAMQEFRIQTSTFAPEFGRTPGAQISIVTRSGTNEFHGNLFDYFRNDVLDANDWFANQAGLPKASTRQNDFGGTLGGPVLLPGYDGRNRTFFFFSYEGLRLRQPQTKVITVPSAASRQAASAQIQPFLNAYPESNGPLLANGFAQFTASYSNPSTQNATSVRLDHTFNPQVTLFGRYSYAPSETVTRGQPGTTLSVSSPVRYSSRTLTLGVTQSFASRFSNELRANYSKTTASTTSMLDTLGDAIPISLSSVLPSSVQSQDSLLVFNIIGAGALILGQNVRNQQRQVNVVDNLSWIVGPHQLKFGVDYRRLSPISGPPRYQQNATFLGLIGPRGALSGTALSAFVGGFQSVVLVSNNFSVYAQDTWKVTPRLTLSYGLRWELNLPIGTKNGEEPIALQGVDSPATLSLAPPGTPLHKTTYKNFAPRVGISYLLNQRSGWETVLRGGAGIFYDLGSGNLGFLPSGFPFTSSKFFSGVPYPLAPSQAAPATFSVTPPVGVMFSADPNLKLPRTYQWNLALEQSVGSSQTLSATYVAAIGRRLLRGDSFFQPNPSFSSSVTITRNAATSDYHALQTQYHRRLSRGLQVLASYTWSHSIDNASADSRVFPPAAVVNPQIDRGSSDFDIRQSFSAAVSYDIPSPALGRASNVFLRGWSVDTLYVARTAPPVDLVGATNFVGFLASVRPDLVPGVPLLLFDPSFAGGKQFNRAAFTAPQPGRQGTFPRNVLRGFDAWQMDFAVRRQFHLTEKLSLQFRAEFFNVFNHPNFGNPVTSISNPLFGQSTEMLGRSLGSGGVSGGFSPLYQIGGPRSVQLALKLQF